MSAELLQEGEQRLAELQEDAARRDAEAALLRECESGGIPELEAALAQALAAKVNDEVAWS